MGTEEQVFNDEPITEDTTEGETQDDAGETADQKSASAPDVKGGEEGGPKKPLTLEALTAQVDQLAKESDGRLKTIRSERKARQAAEASLNELKGKVDALTTIFSEAKARRTAAPDGGTTTPQGEDTQATVQVGKKAIPVKFDDDGNPYIAPDDLDKLTPKQVRTVDQKLERIEQTQALTQQQERVKRDVEAVLSTDPAYPGAYQDMFKAYAFADKSIEKIIERQDIDLKDLDLERAVDLLEADKGFMKEFSANYPGVDLDVVIDGVLSLQYASQGGLFSRRKFQKALNALKGLDGPNRGTGKGADKLAQMKSLGRKPSNLGNLRNQGPSGTAKAVEELTVNDILSMSDTDIAKLEQQIKALEEEE